MNAQQIEEMCKKPGPEGRMWRLVRQWNPDKIGTWIEEEAKTGLTPEEAVVHVAEIMAGASFLLVTAIGGDRQGCAAALVEMYSRALGQKLQNNSAGQINGIIRPKPKIILPGG